MTEVGIGCGCEACSGYGFLHAYNTDERKQEVQRCDSCEIFENDDDALQYVVDLARTVIAKVRAM